MKKSIIRMLISIGGCFIVAFPVWAAEVNVSEISNNEASAMSLGASSNKDESYDLDKILYVGMCQQDKDAPSMYNVVFVEYDNEKGVYTNFYTFSSRINPRDMGDEFHPIGPFPSWFYPGALVHVQANLYSDGTLKTRCKVTQATEEEIIKATTNETAYDYAFVGPSGSGKVYYLLDLDSSKWLSFFSTVPAISEGALRGDLETGLFMYHPGSESSGMTLNLKNTGDTSNAVITFYTGETNDLEAISVEEALELKDQG